MLVKAFFSTVTGHSLNERLKNGEIKIAQRKF